MSHSVTSIQNKLRKIAQATGKDFQLILTRYFQERLLFRLSQTRYNEHFCLKGGVLLYAIDLEASRPTLDLDLLSMKIQLDKDLFSEIFREICNTSNPEDGVRPNSENITVIEIMEQRRYAGLRVKVHISLGTMRQLMSIDIGFGDVVTPRPHWMTYPTLLDMEAPKIKAYSTETVIAEKFEAMIDLAESNSRMKDFYDVWRLLSQKHFDADTLQKAIFQTFSNRQTALSPNHPVFNAAFGEDMSRNKLWDNFLRRSKLDAGLAFHEVLAIIREHLQPVYEELLSKDG